MSYETFQQKSDAELHDLFCISECLALLNSRLEELNRWMPEICKSLST